MDLGLFKQSNQKRMFYHHIVIFELPFQKKEEDAWPFPKPFNFKKVD
jgi:hypothetical protein